MITSTRDRPLGDRGRAGVGEVAPGQEGGVRRAGWLGRGQATAQERAPGQPSTFGVYATNWLASRELKPRTRSHYRALLDHQLKPWDAVAVKDIRPESVREWYAAMGKSTAATRAHAYGLLRTILATAVSDSILPVNPCHIRGAGTAKRRKKVVPASLEELTTITAAMPERYRLMVLLASWCALRFGELVELRCKDIDLKAG